MRKVNPNLNLRRNVEDLLNAVVIQAADDYRESAVKLMMEPENSDALHMMDECREFFFSENFRCFSALRGPDIFYRLDAEQRQYMERYQYFLEQKMKMLLEARAYEKSGLSDTGHLEIAAAAADQVLKISRKDWGVWSPIFRLTTREKKLIRKLRNRRKKLDEQKKRSERAGVSGAVRQD